MAGYSKRSLVEKLGIKEGAEILILNAPGDYDQSLAPLPSGVSRKKKAERIYGIHPIFYKTKTGTTEGISNTKKTPSSQRNFMDFVAKGDFESEDRLK